MRDRQSKPARTRPAPEVWLLLLPLLGVAVVGGLAWREAGTSAEQALTQRGEALLSVAQGTVRASVQAMARTQSLEQARLTAVARRIDTALPALQGPAAPLLREIATQERIGRIFLFGPKHQHVARIVHPPPVVLPSDDAMDLAAWEWPHAQQSLASLGHTPGAVAAEGVRPNAFGVRERLSVAVRLSNGGAVVVRAEQAALARLHAQVGVASVLQRMLDVPDVASVAVAPADNGAAPDVQVGQSPPGAPATFAATLNDLTPPLRVTMQLSRQGVEQAVARQRRSILVWSSLAAAAVLGGLIVFLRMARARRQADEARREAEQQRMDERAHDRRLAEMGALAGLFAHEVSNPLNAVALDLSRLTGDDERTQSMAARMRTALGDARTTIESYLQLAQQTTGAHDRGYTLADARETARDLAVEFDAALPLSTTLRVSARTFDLALRNLIRNARDCRTGAQVRVRCADSPDGGLALQVHDDGPGFDEEVLASRGRLGLTHRAQGHGLGLALSRRFLENDGCQLVLGRSEPLGGAVAEIRVPPARLLEPAPDA